MPLACKSLHTGFTKCQLTMCLFFDNHEFINTRGKFSAALFFAMDGFVLENWLILKMKFVCEVDGQWKVFEMDDH